MSASNFKKNFSNKLLERLEIEMRKKVERQRGQLLIIPGPDQLKKAVIDTFGSDVEITPSQYSSAIEKGREEAEKQAKRFKAANRLRYVAVVGKLPDLGLPNSYVLGKNMFIVSSFSYSIGQVKAKMLKHFTDNKILTDDQKKTLSRNIHKGHGVKGSAVSQVQIASAISVIPLENKNELSSLTVRLNAPFIQYYTGSMDPAINQYPTYFWISKKANVLYLLLTINI